MLLILGDAGHALPTPLRITIQHLNHSVEITGLRFFELILFSLERTLIFLKGTICPSRSPKYGCRFTWSCHHRSLAPLHRFEVAGVRTLKFILLVLSLLWTYSYVWYPVRCRYYNKTMKMLLNYSISKSISWII